MAYHYWPASCGRVNAPKANSNFQGLKTSARDKFVSVSYLVPNGDMDYNLSMALQFFVGSWPLFQFLNLIHSR
jgi:hypothetical protein